MADATAASRGLTRVLHSALQGVEDAARGQRWDGERPWRRTSHLWWDGPVLVVDLHDLKAKNARKAVEAVVPVAADHDLVAVTFVTGRGRHSAGRSVLPGVVREVLGEHRAAGVRLVQSGAGRLSLVLDPARAPAHLRGGLGLWFWLGVAAFGVAAAYAVLAG